MIHITINNIKIPALGYGTAKVKGADGQKAMEYALSVGYRHLDTAQMYDNETEVGAAVKASGIARSEIFITTKVNLGHINEGVLQKSVDTSLKKLQSDYADLLLIHWPVTKVPFAEQMKALMEVQKNGKAKLVGVSNFTVAQMKEVVEEIGAPVVNNQVEYHPYLSQKPVLDYVRAHGMFLTAYCPIARGKVLDDVVITKIAKKHGKTATQVTLRWLIQQDKVAAIPRSGNEARIRENFDIFDFALTAEEMTEISSLARPDGRIISPDFAPAWDKAA